MLIDMHTHIIPRAWLEELERRPVGSLAVEGGAEARPAIHTAGVTFRLSPEFIEPAHAVERMDRVGIDAHVVSPPTFLFHYGDPGRRALELSRIINDAYAEAAETFRGRILPMATVPLQDVGFACEELDRVANKLGIRGVEIGSVVGNLHLGDLALRPFFKEAARLGVFVFVHPLTQSIVGEQGLEFAYLRNLVGIPTSTAFAIESAIFDGLLEDVPSLRIGFAHGGGISSALVDRWERAWQETAENERPTRKSPLQLYRSLFFDTIMHGPEPLSLLFERADPRRIMLGSDFPADMGTQGFPGAIEKTSLWSSEDAVHVKGLTANALFAKR